MSLCQSPSSPPSDSDCWAVKAETAGWRIEVHRDYWAMILDHQFVYCDWKPVRLRGPDGTVVASASSIKEFVAVSLRVLPQLEKQRPGVTTADLIRVKDIGLDLAFGLGRAMYLRT